MPTASRAEDVSAIPEQLVQAFSDFYPAWTRWLRTTLHHSGVTPARVRLLAVLKDAPAMTMTALSQALHVSPRNITTLVDGLEIESLVRRVRHPEDRRATIIELTDAGRELCSRLWGDHIDGASQLFSAVSVAEQHDLLRMIRTLSESLKARGLN